MTKPPTPPRVDLPKEQRTVKLGALLAVAVCGSTLALACLALPRLLAFPQDLAERLAFALRADLLIALWVVLAVRMVAKVRFTSAEDNAGSAYSRPSVRLAVPAAFLQNTLEQAFIAVVGHLALATTSGEAPLAYIACAVALFCLGRLTFLRGYPQGAGGRAFGVATTAIPSVGAYAWTLIEIARDLL
ncbi:MAPEG family protein [Phenylobacterium sp. VNQ135]|uniref:MAPEG family protein n=1 Tax=Phenylobacterium sp. VNQ135 TaxID=3400922 RepID=UPI003C076989